MQRNKFTLCLKVQVVHSHLVAYLLPVHPMVHLLPTAKQDRTMSIWQKCQTSGNFLISGNFAQIFPGDLPAQKKAKRIGKCVFSLNFVYHSRKFWFLTVISYYEIIYEVIFHKIYYSNIIKTSTPVQQMMFVHNNYD